MGVLDFAGGTVVHMSAGLAALAGALVLGRRQSHIANEPHEPANIPYVLLGTGMLWFGWFGFNAGSALAANDTAVLAFATTNTASAAAMLGWVFFDMVRGRKPSAMGACIGAVVGPGRHHASRRVRHRAPQHRHRARRQHRQQPRGVLEVAKHARRHARCLPLPRRRRHGRHDHDRRVCQGRRPGQRLLAHVRRPPARARRRHRLCLHRLLVPLPRRRHDVPMRVSPDAETDGLDLSQHGEVAATFDADTGGPASLLEHVA